MKLPNKLAINTIYKNLPGMNQAQLDALNESIANSPQNVIKLDAKSITKKLTDKTFAVRLMKWVEPYDVGGVNFSLFYTEVDHNYKVGDKVFIIGGEYDSDNIRENNTDPYYPGIDGYKVLYADRTKVVLNIEYSGVEPTNEEPIDNFIKIYVANTQYEFDYFMQSLSMRDDNGNLENKFTSGYNNFLYLNGTFTISPGSFDNLQSFWEAPIIFTTTNGNGFYSMVKFGVNRFLYDVSTDISDNTISTFLNPDYNDPLSGFYNIGKIRVMNGRFTFGDTEFKRDHIYYYNTTQNKWLVDRSYMPTIITKSNFRGGHLDSGEFNQGLYGHYDKRLSYNGAGVKWSLGTILNVNWIDGTLGSNHYYKDSNFTVFDRTGLPQVRANSENNGGAGYNYVFDTDFQGGDVINGNIFNLSTFYGTMSSVSALESYIEGTPISYSVTLSGGVYYNSDILFANIKNSTLISSYIVNSLIENSKSVNSEIVSSAFINSLYLGDNVIKIQAYEESNIKWYDENTLLSVGVDYKMYKFYITDASFLRMRELQYFYLKDVIVNVQNQELLNFFDDKFQIGHWTQTYDEIGLKSERQVLVQLSTKEENRNSPGVISSETDLQPNFDNTLPSIDIFISGGEDFNYVSGTAYPRTYIGDTVNIENAYILEGDFVSGLFKDSTWVSGNHIGYNLDYSMGQVLSNYQGSNSNLVGPWGPYTLNTSEQSIVFKLPLSRRPDILGTYSYQSSIVFLNSMYYDSISNTTNTGTNLVRLPDTYKISEITYQSNFRKFKLQDISTQSSISNWGYNVTNTTLFTSPESRNRYNYLHPVKFENSIIKSGLFRRAYFDSCVFTNFEFNIQDKDLIEVNDKRSFLISDVIFDNNSNVIESGIFQHSHFVSGSDNWKDGIFNHGIWSESTTTYSYSPTSSNIITKKPSNFKGGIFRESQWVTGVFENGIFYKNGSNQPGISIYSGTVSAYYDSYPNISKWAWMDGVFENGDFEKSNFEKGLFLDGNFFNSNLLTGMVNGGNFGKKNIPFSRSRVYTGTFSNVNVINAEFITADPTGNYSTQSITWNSGIFNSGVFGVKMDGYPTYNPNTYLLSNTWHNGSFNGGDFTDVSEWKDGEFNGGRFLSFYGYSGQTPYELRTTISGSFSWQGGKFNNGEFGRGVVGTNSTWFGGEFNSGKFNGRYWNNGIFTRGQFNGHASIYNTSINSHDKFINSYNNEYYGYWNDGWVSPIKDKFITSEKIWGNIERESTKKKVKPNVNFNNMLWNSGTFSHTDGEMNNCVWLGGNHQEGRFVNSSFNPYKNISLPFFEGNVFSNWVVSSGLTPSQSGEYVSISSATTLTIPNCLFIGETYTFQIDVNTNTLTNDVTINSGDVMVGSGISTILTNTFISNSNDLEIVFTGTGDISFKNLIVYSGTISGFNTSDTCIWEHGQAYSSDFYFSKWKQGTFNSYPESTQGNAWGVIWQDGLVKYMNANNVFWENGNWKNGNWNGSPFTDVVRPICTNVVINGGFDTDTDWVINYYDISGYGGGAIISGGSYNFTEYSHGGPTILPLTGENFSTLVQLGILTVGLNYTITAQVSNNAFGYVMVNGSDMLVNGTDGNGVFSVSFTASSTDLSLEIGSTSEDAANNGWTLSLDNIVVQYCTSNNTIVYPGFASDIINNISMYATNSTSPYSTRWYKNIHMNDTFTVDDNPTNILSDNDLINGFGTLGSVTQLGGTSWIHDTTTTVPINISTSIVGLALSIGGYEPSSVYNIWNSNNEYIYATAGGTTDIFNQIGDYTIEVEYFITAKTSPSSIPNDWTFDFDIEVGPSASPTIFNVSETFNIPQGLSLGLFTDYGIPDNTDIKMGWSGVQTQTINYTVNTIQPDNELKIKLPTYNVSPILQLLIQLDVRVFITKISIVKQTISYDDPGTNNNLWVPSTWTPQIGSDITMPQYDISTGILYNANGVSSKFGNGMFISGIWENGVWNEGWREDYTTIWCSDLTKFVGGKNEAYRVDTWTWRFTMKLIPQQEYPGILGEFRVGDKVSVGNLVTIDINGDRRLIRDCLTVSKVDINNLEIDLSVTINFPIRSIERDSENHLIYITKNVWLNGVFLNGKFLNGVWNNGLFQGFPYITKIEDSHWIDGIFKGGYLKGLTNSYFSDNSVFVNYHTSVIQKFEFYDENVSNEPYEFKYNSWIDVNYYVTEGVNINRPNQVYKQTSLGFTTSFTENNFYGYPTMDVLDSTSTLRNGYDLDKRTYRLGWKWKEYTNSLIEVGEFLDINEYSYLNSTIPTLTSGIGLSNLFSDGWTYSYQPFTGTLISPSGFSLAGNSIKSNVGNLDSEWLYLSNNRILGTFTPPDNTLNFTVDIFNNSNVDIDKLRYNFIEIEAENINTTQTTGVSNPIVFYNNYPASYSIDANATLFNGNDITIPINQLASPTVTRQREYFFNKRTLDMTIFSGPSYNIRFKKIRFVETDMIPFTQIASNCVKKKTISLWDTTPVVQNPGQELVVSPPDPPYPYPGQWELALPTGETSVFGYQGNLDVLTGQGNPTWDNFYLVFGGSGCQSYINENIEVPYVATSPSIDVDTVFGYISSINIELSQVTVDLLPPTN